MGKYLQLAGITNFVSLVERVGIQVCTCIEKCANIYIYIYSFNRDPTTIRRPKCG